MSQENEPPAADPLKGRLRLSVLLAQLRDDALRAGGGAPPSAVAADEVSDGTRPAPGSVTLGEIADRTREAGFGFIIAFLGICAMPFPGVSVPFGVAIVFGAAQMVVGLRRPWLPQRLRRRQISAAGLERLGRWLKRWLGWLEYVVRPRFEFMLHGPGWMLLGLALTLLGLGLALPLPLPGSNVVFAVPILLYAIAMLERDGLLVMLGHAILAVEISLVVQLWDKIVAGVLTAVGWLTGA